MTAASVVGSSGLRREQSAQNILNSKQHFPQASKSNGIRQYVRAKSDNGTKQKVRLPQTYLENAEDDQEATERSFYVL